MYKRQDYDLREYRAGDSLRSIHWKLSSKKDELVVRETLEPRQAEVILTYDHFGTPEELDRTFDELAALSRLLLDKGRAHHIQWAAPASGQVEDRTVDGEQALTCLLYTSGNYAGEDLVLLGGELIINHAPLGLTHTLNDDLAGSLGGDAAKVPGLDPVSYTHLDVYKRQGRG